MLLGCNYYFLYIWYKCIFVCILNYGNCGGMVEFCCRVCCRWVCYIVYYIFCCICNGDIFRNIFYGKVCIDFYSVLGKCCVCNDFYIFGCKEDMVFCRIFYRYVSKLEDDYILVCNFYEFYLCDIFYKY